jgi:uncharacterized membrane protein
MNERDTSVDILRGIAIFTMIAANMGSHSLIEPHSFSFRFYGSIAAPLFVFLAGLMVVYTLHLKSHKLGYFLKRAAMTILVAVLIDLLIWGTLPFVTFDVLYLIGFAMPMIYFFYKLPLLVQLCIVIALFSMTPLLQNYMGYNLLAVESPVTELKRFSDIFNTRSASQFLIDGWFPLFPWLGVSLLGAFIGSLKFKFERTKYHRTLWIAGAVLFVSGVASWIIAKPVLLIRDGYSELFYPPTLYYMSTFMGMILLLIPLAYRVKDSVVFKQLAIYGRSSMFVYILHTVLIVYVLNLLPATTFWPYMGLYLIHALVLWLACFGVQKLVANRKPPFIVSFILGR